MSVLQFLHAINHAVIFPAHSKRTREQIRTRCGNSLYRCHCHLGAFLVNQVKLNTGYGSSGLITKH
ncbi:MAG: Uncharacterised protein [Rhodobiaceae bacterium UBA7378]|nr:MAG: Uncharacterised protein [Rhodobiaceae bacterium UBA7378]